MSAERSHRERTRLQMRRYALCSRESGWLELRLREYAGQILDEKRLRPDEVMDELEVLSKYVVEVMDRWDLAEEVFDVKMLVLDWTRIRRDGRST